MPDVRLLPPQTEREKKINAILDRMAAQVMTFEGVAVAIVKARAELGELIDEEIDEALYNDAVGRSEMENQ